MGNPKPHLQGFLHALADPLCSGPGVSPRGDFTYIVLYPPKEELGIRDSLQKKICKYPEQLE